MATGTMNFVRNLTLTMLVCIAALAGAADPTSSSAPVAVQPNAILPSSSNTASDTETRPPAAWDFSPYRVLIWLSSDDPSINVVGIDRQLRAYLDRDFSSVWRVDLKTTPTAIGTLAARNMSALNYDMITASDPVIAVKRDAVGAGHTGWAFWWA